MKHHLEKRARCEYFVILDDVGLRIVPAQLKTHPRKPEACLVFAHYQYTQWLCWTSDLEMKTTPADNVRTDWCDGKTCQLLWSPHAPTLWSCPDVRPPNLNRLMWWRVLALAWKPDDNELWEPALCHDTDSHARASLAVSKYSTPTVT